jgi:hypothetical protein
MSVLHMQSLNEVNPCKEGRVRLSRGGFKLNLVLVFTDVPSKPVMQMPKPRCLLSSIWVGLGTPAGGQ